MTVLRYLPFLISFRDDEHPEGYEGQEYIKGQYAEHPEAFLSHSARGDIDDDCLHNPAEEEEEQSEEKDKNPSLPLPTREGVKIIYNCS